jgi:hypothetical protein
VEEIRHILAIGIYAMMKQAYGSKPPLDPL